MKEEHYETDAFGNLSSTRKLRRQIVYFTLVLIAFMVLPICIRIAINGISDMKIDYSVTAFLLGIILILLSAAFVPTAFAQSKEWMAFIQDAKKK